MIHCGHEQDLPSLAGGPAAASAAVGDGVRARGARGALCAQPGSRRAGPFGDPCGLWGGAGLSAVSSGDDDGASALRLQPRGLFLAAARAGVRGAAGLPGGDGDEPAGPPDDLRVPAAASCGLVGSVRAGAEAVPGGGTGAAGPCRAGRDEDRGQRLQAQGDELRADEEGGSGAEGGGGRLARGGRSGGRRGGRPARRGPRRRDARVGEGQGQASGEDPGGQGGAGGRGQGRAGGQGRGGGRLRPSRPARADASPRRRPGRPRTRRSATSPIRRAGS